MMHTQYFPKLDKTGNAKYCFDMHLEYFWLFLNIYLNKANESHKLYIGAGKQLKLGTHLSYSSHSHSTNKFVDQLSKS